MQLSRYNYILHDKNRYIIYNGISGACIVLTTDEFNYLSKFTCSAEKLAEYARLGFLVDDTLDERKKVVYLSREFDKKQKNGFFRILTTTACNAKCDYCYEDGFKIETMTMPLAIEVVNFIKNQVNNYNNIHIQWFGGEPLCNIAPINYISEQVVQYLKSQSVAFSSSIITNGSLFDEKLIDVAKNEWKTAFVQITLDGTKNEYEKIKSYRDKGVFEIVLQNIHCLIEAGINVNLRLNYSQNSVEDIKKLIRQLSNEFPNKELIYLYPFRIFQESKDFLIEFELKKMIEEFGFIQDYALMLKPQRIPCIAQSMNGYTIMPNGDLAKCCRGSNLYNGIVGNIFNKKLNNNIVDWCSFYIDEECFNCKFLPLCNGGCLYEHFTNGKKCLIEEERVQFALRELLNQSYRQE